MEKVNVNLGGRQVLHDISLQVPKGACVGIVGPNGSGKTSLLRTIGGLIRPVSGRVTVMGSTPTRANRKANQIGYVPQVRSIDKDFPITVEEVVLQGRIGRLGLFRRPTSKDREIVQTCMEKVSIAGLAHRQIGALSGGQQQRAFIARALAQESDLLLFDEPATGLDIPTQQSIYELLEELHQVGVTTLTTTHDLLALDFHRFGYIICLNKELVAFGPSEQVLTAEILEKTFSGFPFPIGRFQAHFQPPAFVRETH
ncbi:MAG TPA: metal ABC transporter ATP-binding protein [Desulfobacteria bacterium]|nr:metal ABC transporter ATP-binding protein [Desulfobacteria bacterium]